MTPLKSHSHRVRRFLTPVLALSVALPAFAQVANTPTTPAEQPATTTTTTKVEEKKDVLQLSPFVVNTSKDTGYFAENTLAGSRLNSKISDLAASITVVTKQQLEDTGALDINDVFRYEANTEGASTYTPVALNRSNVTDNIGGYAGDDGTAFGAATANRVRGLGRVDTAQNNYPTIARWAFDSFNTNSVEISRGPNSMLFGTGAPAGIINQSSATAVLGQRNTQVQLRGGSFGAWRVSANTNIPLGDKVAIFLAGLYDERAYQRKPSEDTYRRQYGAITYKPFRTTLITASAEHYDNYNQRPNFLPPQDRVTPWIRAGRPGFDPTTQIFTFADGRTTQPYLNSTLDARYVAGVTPSADANLTTVPTASAPNPFYIPSLGFIPGRQTLFYNNGNEVGFWVQSASTGSGTFNTTVNGFTGALPAAANQTQAQRLLVATRYAFTAADPVPRPNPATTGGATDYGVWILPHLTDQSIYDWEKYNISGNNYGNQTGNSLNLELQQQILPNLNFSAGWFYQDFEEWTHYGLGQANQAPRLYVDVNRKNLDGSNNPYFGAPFVFDSQADSFYLPETNENLRAMLSYEVDFSDFNSKWLSWLGRHRLLGLVSRQDQWRNNLRYRMSYENGTNGRFLPNLANAGYSWGLNAANIQRIFYLSDGNTGGVVTHGLSPIGQPGFGGPNRSKLSFYNFNTNAWDKADAVYDANLIYAGSNYGVSTRRTDSKSFAWQGYLWKDRIIPTFGWRKDELVLSAFDNRDANNVALNANTSYIAGEGIDGLEYHQGTPREFAGTTRSKGVVARPFQGWAGLDRRADDGSIVADFVRNLGFHYNESDNFNPPGGIQVDFFNNVLPAPSGKGKDYGVQIAMFNNKLVARLNWYEASNENAVSPAANTVVARLSRMDTVSARRWAEYVVRIRSGQNPNTENDFDNNTTRPLSQAQQDAIRDLWWGNFPLKDFRWNSLYQGSINSTESNSSKGKELQLTYNPTRTWTIKWTVGQQQSSYSKVGPELQEWINFRKPQWMAMVAADLPTELTRFDGNKLYLGSFWNGYGFTQAFPQGEAGNAQGLNDAPSNTLGGTGTPATTYTSIVDAVYYPALALQNQKANNIREWSSTVLSSYTISKGMLKGLTFGGQFNWQDKAVAGYQSLLDPTTYARPNATTAQIIFPDLTKPIYTPAIDSVDLFASYSRKVFSDKVRMKIQFNVRDVFEDGGLQTIVFNQDGSPAQYRIKDPRTYFVTTTFDF